MPRDPSAIIRPALDQRQQEIVQRVIEQERIGSEALWEAADGMAELVESGLTQRQIAGLIGKSQTHVVFCLRAVRDYPGNQPRPDWTQAYVEAKRGPTANEVEDVNRLTANLDVEWEWDGLSKAEEDAGEKRVIINTRGEAERTELLRRMSIETEGAIYLDGVLMRTRIVLPRQIKIELEPMQDEMVVLRLDGEDASSE